MPKLNDLNLVYALLLDWKDGASNDSFKAAIIELARYYEALKPEERKIRPGSSPHAAVPIQITAMVIDTSKLQVTN